VTPAGPSSCVNLTRVRTSFTKMQALGNDFVVLDRLAADAPALPGAAVLERLADRHLGVGCDQILVLSPSPSADADVGYRIFNADGGEVGQCGNGVRCVARYLWERAGRTEDGLRVASPGGITRVFRAGAAAVRVDMGEPRLATADVPFLPPGGDAEPGALHHLTLPDGSGVSVAVCSMGNPHAVLEFASLDSAPVATLGPLIEHHPAFPERSNVGFVSVLDSGRVRLRVWERGVGETLACGTGACAAMAVLRARGEVDSHVAVSLPGGQLVIEWNGPGEPLWMTGPADFVFDGWIEL
jgi:diaminopimelate epimerase